MTKWISSDFHYWHKNITYGESVWKNKETTTRKFNTVQEMSRALVESINKYVQQDDELYFLGDFAFSGIQNIWNFRKQIICKNIYFVPGNHDHHIKKNKELPNCSWYPSKSFIYDSMSYHQTDKNISTGESIVFAQDLFTMLPELTTITYNKQKIILSHYPLDHWEDMNHGSIMLHGHTHHQIDNCEINQKYKRMDVGIDWKEFRPYTLDEVLELMEKREIKDHHE